ncbi:RAB6-interacting golgin [Kryptolebias marmoratus]|uniref:RAB6-interacting golgin n=1 Tax=Kryptolebias marmoratus TaxID=37003 RepID=A0A3Q3AR66_KRYMA|nr:RAB6-interacting golgin [Kryptolebias marmoratus]
MSGWAGFSDAELRRIQQKDSAGPAAAVRGRKPPPSGRSRQQLQRERALQLAGSHSLPAGQQLSKPPPKEELEPVVRSGAPGVGLEAPAAARSGAPGVGLEVQQRPADMEPNENHHPEETSLEVKELEKQEVELREKTRLEQLQQEQKLIEERNKRKKALLTKTIAEKSKQTQAEAVKLKRIQKELQALDDMVSNDIGILRGKIEQASWDYTAARKRYEKAEAEYVTAKLDLHKKTEVKEQLTEHLCAIIQQNELRKAHKLEELMQQLQLQATEEEEERRKSCAETQRSGKEGDDSVEGAEQSVEGCRVTEKEEKERGGNLQETTVESLKTLENCGEAETVSS